MTSTMTASLMSHTPPATEAPAPRHSGESKAPICCKRSMTALVRRALVHVDGRVNFSCIWSCRCCGILIK